ncbi:cation:proton antiporter [Streptomyces sp. NPDC048603]|uniref:cation:proton antiporter domain-containing protein n=1 Tax=Streptomyces sp. NPDC048603 TaxID=3365577 RepID=UPI003717956A
MAEDLTLASTERRRPPTGTGTGTGSRPRYVYLLLALVPAALVLAVLRFGAEIAGLDGGSGGASGGAAGKAPAASGTFAALLLALPVILLVCHLTAGLFRRMGQPAVIGEIVAGVLLGPSLLGLLWPSGHDLLFPAELSGPVGILAQLGLVCFMFVVGYELDIGEVRGRGQAVLAISHVGVAVPLLAGALLALGMYGSYAPDGLGFTPFGLFIAVAMSITAFPVLARIIAERRPGELRVGGIALSCAAVGDVTAWCLLAVVVATAAGSSPAGVVWILVLTALFCALLHFAVRPLLRRMLNGTRQARGTSVLPVLFSAILLCALATEEIGIHAIFGPFLLGAVTPRGSAPLEWALGRLRSVTETLLLPLFFVFSGMRTSVGLLDGRQAWLWCLAIVVVATAAKWGSTTLAARGCGMGREDSMALGALMNCRGLTELVVLNVGLDLGVITPTVFTMFVIMALVSTVLTAPALTLVRRRYAGT